MDLLIEVLIVAAVAAGAVFVLGLAGRVLAAVFCGVVAFLFGPFRVLLFWCLLIGAVTALGLLAL